MINPPLAGGYDYGLGIDSQIISYIRESVEVASRISPSCCYLMFRCASGSAVGSPTVPITVTSYTETTPNYKTVIWSSGSLHPDLRPNVNGGKGVVMVYCDNVEMVRITEVEDLTYDNEFSVLKRKDLDPSIVELVFNSGFNPTLHTITYYYNSYQPQIDDTRFQRGEDTTHSVFGWEQYINESSDIFRKKHQILVRVPLTTRDLSINEQGKVILEENQCWMIWEPYVSDFDMLIFSANETFTGREERYEIVNKQDSQIQHVFISQRFKLNYIEEGDPRYKIPYRTT